MDVLALFIVLNIGIIIDFRSSNPEEERWCADLVNYAILGEGGIITTAKAYGKTPNQALEKMVNVLKGCTVISAEYIPGTSVCQQYFLPKALYV